MNNVFIKYASAFVVVCWVWYYLVWLMVCWVDRSLGWILFSDPLLHLGPFSNRTVILPHSSIIERKIQPAYIEIIFLHHRARWSVPNLFVSSHWKWSDWWLGKCESAEWLSRGATLKKRYGLHSRSTLQTHNHLPRSVKLPCTSMILRWCCWLTVVDGSHAIERVKLRLADYSNTLLLQCNQTGEQNQQATTYTCV